MLNLLSVLLCIIRQYVSNTCKALSEILTFFGDDKMDKLQFTVYGARWFDKVNGNTYHSCRVVRHSDGAVICAPLRYGYGNHYQQTALELMVEKGWIDAKYKKEPFMYERENNYPINWIVTDGLKRDCVRNGKE